MAFNELGRDRLGSIDMNKPCEWNLVKKSGPFFQTLGKSLDFELYSEQEGRKLVSVMIDIS